MDKNLTGVTTEIARVKRVYDALEVDLREELVEPGMLFTARTVEYFAPTMRGVMREWDEMRDLVDAASGAGSQHALTKALQLAFMAGIVYGAEMMGYGSQQATEGGRPIA